MNFAMHFNSLSNVSHGRLWSQSIDNKREQTENKRQNSVLVQMTILL